ncbi:MAG: GNAT family N-acetyltransferase [Actinomycetota bacterium]
MSVISRSERLRVRGRWPGRIELSAGWARAVARPWNDDLPAVALRLERGSSRFLAACADRAVQWSPEVLSPALLPTATRVWLDAGFVESSRMLLFERPVTAIGPDPKAEATRLKAGGIEPIDDLIRVDDLSFPPRWRLGRLGLIESAAATPRAVVHRDCDDDDLIGFAISGTSLGIGYLQRLAVVPDHRRSGVATALVRAALDRARRHGARTMLVNTQPENQAAAALYERMGFSSVPDGLVLLRFSPGS